MGANRIVVHSGSCGKISREEALSLAMDTLRQAIAELDAAGLSEVHICPETMGKVNQLGTLDEVLSLCSMDERLIPLHRFLASSMPAPLEGCGNSSDYEAIFDAIENRLGNDRMRHFHSHFSKINTRTKAEKKPISPLRTPSTALTLNQWQNCWQGRDVPHHHL